MKLERDKFEMTSEEIINILKDKKAILTWPACGQEDFTLVDGDFTQEFIAWGKLPSALGGGRRSFNYIVLVCDNCGYLFSYFFLCSPYLCG